MDRTELLVHRWEDQRTIKNLMGKLANLTLLNREGEIFDRFWSRAEDVCLGFNDGYYVGAQAVAGYYRAAAERNLLVAKLLQAKFPEQLGGKSDAEIDGVGPFKVEPLYNPLIEVAGDGKTAKGLWSCQGAHNEVGTAGPVANWTWGYFAADFIREDDGWRIWHLLRVNDVDC
ncbi:MAG: nuclear transport factor 2 family protein, partial [Oscillospiraceae bacterium]|nr:nuclear transport factor 2 family protein [Oscillospiraceae bacterium]